MADFDGGLKGGGIERILKKTRIETKQHRFATASVVSARQPPTEFGNIAMNTSACRLLLGVLAGPLAIVATSAEAQVVYYGAMRPVVPVVAAPVMTAPAYVSNYTPAGNYAAVTAFSPPVMAQPAAVAVSVNYPPAVAPAVVTAAYAPATTAYYAPATTAYYAPATTAYYAPATTAYYAPAAAVVPAPVTAYYAPAVAVPLYRQGLFGGLRPVRTAYYLPY